MRGARGLLFAARFVHAAYPIKASWLALREAELLMALRLVTDG